MQTWQQHPFSTCWGGGEAQQEVKERWCERISCSIEGVYTTGLIQENLLYVNRENWDQNTPSTSPRARRTKSKFGEERVHREELHPKCAPHERSPCPPKLEERSHEETLHHERCVRGVAWNLANNIYNLKNADKATRYTSVEARAMPAPTSKRPEEREVVVDSGASMRMLSKKDLSSDELDTLRRSRNPITVVAANGEVQTNEEAQVCVYDPDLVVLVQLLEETPAICRLGNSAKTTDIPMSGSTVKNPRLTKESKTFTCKTDHFVPLVFLLLSANSGCNSSSTSTLQCSSSTGPAQERRDGPVPGNWCGSLPKTQNQNKKRDGSRSSWMVGGVHR